VLVAHDFHGAMPPVWRRFAWGSLLVLIVCLLSLAPYLGSSTELVRLRNALLLPEKTSPDFDWTPANIPVGYAQELGPADPFFSQVVQHLGLSDLPDDWTRAVAISRHLLSSSPVLRGGAVMSDLRGTYQRVVTQGDGYCGDFTDVFVALALAAGIPVRTWSFSFDGFGGHGHVWPEIWNRQVGRWQLVDVFNNYYFFENAATPLSALAFRRALLSGSQQLRLAPLDHGARVGWALEGKAWAYYRRGLHEWYMPWGNNVFTYDRSLSVRVFSGVSRSLEQLGAVVEGVYPQIRLLANADNQAQVQAIWRLHIHLLLVGVLVPALALISFFCFLTGARRQRQLSLACLCEGLAYDHR
jgi:hypothetical protein